MNRSPLQNAQEELNTAQYLLNVTLRSLKDPHILVNVIIHIHSSLNYAITALLQYDYQHNTISRSNEPQIVLYQKSAKLHHLEPTHLTFIKKINQIIELHKKSPVEFQRGNKYVLADNQYRLEPLTLTKTQEYVQTTALFINTINQITNRK